VLSSLSEPDRSDLRYLKLSFNRWGRSPSWPRQQRLSRAWFKRIIVDFTFWFFFDGRGILINHKTDESHPLLPGHCLCIVPGMDLEVCQEGDRPLGNTFFHLDFIYRDEALLPKDWPFFPFCTKLVNIAFLNETTRLMLNRLDRAPFSGFKARKESLEAEFLMKGILLEILRSHDQSQRERLIAPLRMGVISALSAIHEDPQRFRTVDDLVRESGYSESHFRALCQKITGESPTQVLIKARIERAKNYLHDSELSVGAIAETVGYENVYYFSRQFRQVVGMSPSDYRRQRGIPRHPATRES